MRRESEPQFVRTPLPGPQEPSQETGRHGLPWGNTRAENDCKNNGAKACNHCRWKEQVKCPGGNPKHNDDVYESPSSRH